MFRYNVLDSSWPHHTRLETGWRTRTHGASGERRHNGDTPDSGNGDAVYHRIRLNQPAAMESDYSSTSGSRGGRSRVHDARSIVNHRGIGGAAAACAAKCLGDSTVDIRQVNVVIIVVSADGGVGG